MVVVVRLFVVMVVVVVVLVVVLVVVVVVVVSVRSIYLKASEGNLSSLVSFSFFLLLPMTPFLLDTNF